MPPLQQQDGSLAVSAKDKTNVLFNRFFTPVIADLSDIRETFPPAYTPSLDTSLSTTPSPIPLPLPPPLLSPLLLPLPSPLLSPSPSPLPLPFTLLALLVLPVLPVLSQPSLSPLSPSFYPVLLYDYSVSYKEVRQTLKERKSYSCPSLDAFPYTFLKALGPLLINILVSIITTC
jgi:hypothetical protein